DFWEIRKYYNGARINLNIHRDPVDPPSGNSQGVGAESPNDRTFALAGCGAFQLVDRTRAGLWDCFTDGGEMVGFTDPEDLAAKIQEYLAKPVARAMIGEAAQQKAYRYHTYKHRLTEVLRRIGRFAERNWETPVRSSPARVFVFPATVLSPGQGLLYKTRGTRGR
ncbi:MAG: glycosyltransferase family 1 protein, partial [Clostridia bacterium]|nr:glycosyltransferase family 1 protein [Clostridia bacterium]